MNSTFNKTRVVFMLAFFLIGLSIRGLQAQQPNAPKLSITFSEKDSKEAVLPSTRTNPNPRFIDGYLSWARDLANPSIYAGFGTGSDNNFMVAHRYETSDLTPFDGKSLSKVSFIPTQSDGTYTAKVWVGGNASNPGSLVAEATFSNVQGLIWNDVPIVPSVQIDADEELWIGIQCVADFGYPMGFDVGPQVDGKGNLFNSSGEWEATQSTDPSSILNSLNFCIKGYLQDVAVASATCPSDPQDVFITPASDFSLSTTLLWDNPSVDVAGNALSGLTSVIILRDGEVIQTVNNPTPGASESFTDNSVSQMGWYEYSIYATNVNGNGLSVTSTIFVGPMIVMSTSGTQSFTMDAGVFYDDGGKFGWYSLNCSSLVTIYPADPEKGIHIYGTFEIETNWDKLIVYDGADVTGEILGTFTNTEGGVIPEITSASGPMTFQFTSDNSLVKEGFEIFVESVLINNDCLPPIDLIVASTTESSASLSWTPGSGDPESYTIAYKLASATEYTEIDGIGNPPYTLTGLTASNAYDWKIRTTCANASEPSSWSVVSSFQTTCAGAEAPVSEDFNALQGGNVPECWQQYAVMNADWENRFYPCVDDYADFAHSGERYLKFWMTAVAEENTIALLPLVDNIQYAEISFFARYNVNVPYFELGVMEGNNFVSIQEIPLTDSYQQFTVSMSNYSGSSHRFAFRSSYAGIAHVFVDDITITSSGTPVEYTITATAGANGSITPNGEVTVIEGENQTFAISADAGYEIEDVLVDGASVGTVEEYTFENVSADHAISATFVVKPAIDEVAQSYSVFPNPANGSVTVKGENLEMISIYNISGQLLETVMVKGATSKTIATSHYKNGTYVLQLLSKDGSISTQRVVVNH